MDENSLNEMLIPFKSTVPHIEQIWLHNRLETLKNWPMAQPSAREIAEAGFFCPDITDPDETKCFSCFIELNGWEQGDNPLEEHKKRALLLSPPCKFVEIGKEQSQLTVEDYIDIIRSVLLRYTMVACVKKKNSLVSAHEKVKKKLKKDLQKRGLPETT